MHAVVDKEFLMYRALVFMIRTGEKKTRKFFVRFLHTFICSTFEHLFDSSRGLFGIPLEVSSGNNPGISSKIPKAVSSGISLGTYPGSTPGVFPVILSGFFLMKYLLGFFPGNSSEIFEKISSGMSPSTHSFLWYFKGFLPRFIRELWLSFEILLIVSIGMPLEAFMGFPEGVHEKMKSRKKLLKENQK